MENDFEVQYFTGEVTGILEETTLPGQENLYLQKLEVTAQTGEVYTVEVGNEFEPLSADRLRTTGEHVVLAQQPAVNSVQEVVLADSYRLPTVFLLSIIFGFIVISVGRFKGFFSIIGMVVSILILMFFIVPQILSGANPIAVSLFGSFVIASFTVYLSHGYNIKSHLALFSMMTALLFVALISYVGVETADLFGLGSDEAGFLQVGSTSSINLQGLLLGGIMLGALGVLDDVTVSQISVVFQLKAAKKDMQFSELYHRSIEVGRDHVASLVNTLVLAYAGANMPLFLLFSINEAVPNWVMLNNELIVEEVIRTLVGSMGLVIAVPFTTVIAAYYAMRISKKELETHSHTHSHSHHH